jgi:type III pantothenate kinase
MAERANLAVDIGNTNTVLGLFRAGKIRRRWRLATRRDYTVDEIAWQLEGLLGAEKGSIEAVALASVVPALDDGWTSALETVFGAAPQVLDWTNCLGLELDYEIPRQIGADRLANVLGAHAMGHKEGVVIDLGTATTFDVFGPNNYRGGVICPGIQTSMRTLAQNAAKLSEVELRWTDKAVGKTTDDALRIGIVRGAIGQIEYLIKEIVAELGMRKPSIIATGGLAPLVGNRSKAIGFLEPDLTLVGINHLLEGVRGAPGDAKKKKKSKGKK